MNSAEQMKSRIRAMNGRGYPNYRDLKGEWQFDGFVLSVDHVQSDPFASPSSLSVHIAKPNLPKPLYAHKVQRIALQDALLRMFGKGIAVRTHGGFDSKTTGKVSCASCCQEVLERSACTIDPNSGSLILCFNASFPARGRSILAVSMIDLVFRQIVSLVERYLFYDHLSDDEKQYLQTVYELSVDQQKIREELEARHLVAFVSNGAILPRESGSSDQPMKDAVPFVSAPGFEVELDLPYAGKMKGMAIPEGITLIVGGGYHGKSTLLEALQAGVYDHIPFDGREYVITKSDAMKIRAEDGRSVHTENISSFVRNLPGGRSTEDFISEDASGSTSQAANVMEALESGSRILLMDEDTSATNFLIRDELMSEVVSSSQEPLIPYIARIRALASKGISTILVAGSSGLYFHEADHVILMDNYKPYGITHRAKEKAAAYPRPDYGHYPLLMPSPKRIAKSNHQLDQEKTKIKTIAPYELMINRERVDLRALEQLADLQQAAAIGKMLVFAQKRGLIGKYTMEELANTLLELCDEKGLSIFGSGALARPRRQELLGVLNHLRSQSFRFEKQAINE